MSVANLNFLAVVSIISAEMSDKTVKSAMKSAENSVIVKNHMKKVNKIAKIVSFPYFL